MVVYYHRHAPVLLAEDSSPVHPIQLDPRLLDVARRLGAWTDFLVIAANAVHKWQEEIGAAAGRPVLSMIDVTLEEVDRRRWRRVGLLTFMEPGVYRQPLEKARRGVRSPRR